MESSDFPGCLAPWRTLQGTISQAPSDGFGNVAEKLLAAWLPGCLAMSGGRFTVRNGLAREHELIWGRGGGQWILVGNWTFFVRKTT